MYSEDPASILVVVDGASQERHPTKIDPVFQKSYKALYKWARQSSQTGSARR